ncbi:hypothetical protein C8Q77DRAFT_848994 [Trametes polyzona]|nr:hypothetical protein C8Q77DRAFT_848994 [Trametes polyzona]
MPRPRNQKKKKNAQGKKDKKQQPSTPPPPASKSPSPTPAPATPPPLLGSPHHVSDPEQHVHDQPPYPAAQEDAEQLYQKYLVEYPPEPESDDSIPMPLLKTPFIYDPGDGPRVKDPRAFLASRLAAPPSLDDAMCAEFAEEAVLQMLCSVLPEETALILWYNKSRRTARICPACQRLYRLGDVLPDHLAGENGEQQRATRASPYLAREQEISGLCSPVCFILAAYNYPGAIRSTWGRMAEELDDATWDLLGAAPRANDLGLGMLLKMTRCHDLGLAQLFFPDLGLLEESGEGSEETVREVEGARVPAPGEGKGLEEEARHNPAMRPSDAPLAKHSSRLARSRPHSGALVAHPRRLHARPLCSRDSPFGLRPTARRRGRRLSRRLPPTPPHGPPPNHLRSLQRRRLHQTTPDTPRTAHGPSGKVHFTLLLPFDLPHAVYGLHTVSNSSTLLVKVRVASARNLACACELTLHILCEWPGAARRRRAGATGGSSRLPPGIRPGHVRATRLQAWARRNADESNTFRPSPPQFRPYLARNAAALLILRTTASIERFKLLYAVSGAHRTGSKIHESGRFMGTNRRPSLPRRAHGVFRAPSSLHSPSPCSAAKKT